MGSKPQRRTELLRYQVAHRVQRVTSAAHVWPIEPSQIPSRLNCNFASKYKGSKPS